MRVLLAHKFFHLTGGAEVFFFETGRILSANGNDVAYFSTKHEKNQDSEWGDYFVEPPAYDGTGLERVLAVGRSIYSREARTKFSALIRQFRPDIVHVFASHVHLTPSIMLAARDAGVPVVMSCNDYKHICPSYRLFHHGSVCFECEGGRFYRAVVNRCLKDSVGFSAVAAAEAYVHRLMGVRDMVHTYLFASEFMAAITERFWRDYPLRWETLRNPFDSTKFPQSPHDDGFALYFGRLVEEKGVDVLLRAAALAPEVQVRIVGDGPEEQSLREMADRMALGNIEFLGPKWGADLQGVLERCGFVVVPSTWHENFPYVINQAFSVGKPVIGSNMGGIPELVAHGQRGLVFDPTDPADLASRLRALGLDVGLRSELGKAAKAWSDRNFNDDAFYTRVSNIYARVLS